MFNRGRFNRVPFNLTVNDTPPILITSSDVLRISGRVESHDVQGSLAVQERITGTVHDYGFLRNIRTIMNADVRQIFCRIEITYTGAFKDSSLTYAASETAPYTYPEQLADGYASPPYKWASLHNNSLDGTFHLLPSASEKRPSVGWWGTTLSDATGAISTNPTVSISFSPRALASLRVSGDPMLQEYPVDFVINVYDASGVILTRTVVGNTQVTWTESFSELLLGVTKTELIISRINKPNSVAKVTEFFTAIKEIYEADEIESMRLLEEIGYTTGSLPIGNVSSNEIDITLSNADRRFDLNNTASPLYGYIKRNRQVQVWLGAAPGEEIEWYPVGTFWTTQWDVPTGMLIANLVARDRMELLRLSDFTTSQVYLNQTLLWLFELVLNDAGLDPEEYDLDPELSSVVIPYAWFGRMSHREALQRLAGCAVVQVYCTKEGKIKVNYNLDATAYIATTYDDDVNVFSATYPLAVAEQVNYIEVTAKQKVIGPSESVYDSDEQLSIAAGQTVTATYEINGGAVMEVTAVTPTVTGSVVVQSYSVYAWGVEVIYKNNGGSTGSVTHLVLTGKILKDGGTQLLIAKDDVSIFEDGTIKQPLNHDFIQSGTYAQALATSILNTYKSSRYDVTLENRGDITVNLGDRVIVNDDQQGTSLPYVVSRQRVEWNGVLSASTEAKRL